MSAEAFAVSTGIVTLGEIGDKTQLLALILAARYKLVPVQWVHRIAAAVFAGLGVLILSQ